MLSARAEKKLERIVEIQEEMEKLEAELEEILGSPTLPSVGDKGEKREKRTYTKRGGESATTRSAEKKSGRICSNCGQPGHDLRKCPKGKGVYLTDGQEKHRSNREPCAECGSKGSRHFKTCSKYGQRKETIPSFAGSDDSPEAPSPIEPLTSEQYGAIRSAMNDREFMSAKYALVNKLRPTEVNHAVRSSSYEHYLDIRSE